MISEGGTLVAAGVFKQYPGVQALDDVSATFRPGEIHAVLGENGAGKSTLMGVLAGFVVPDAGTVSLDGVPAPFGRPHETKRRGIVMVHQHFTLVPALTVAENLSLARVQGIRVHRPSEDAKDALDFARDLGWSLDPSALVRDLPVGVQQRVEIVKAVSSQANVLILDEPTAVLSADEVDDLFRVLRRLRDQGRTIILIAHKLREVMAIADRVTVLRRGRFVASCETAETSTDQLAHWMVGEQLQQSSTSAPKLLSDRSLRVTDLSVSGDRGELAIRNISFHVGGGEILGIGGVDGNGQVELAEALAGVRPSQLDLGDLTVAYIPQDRQTEGLGLSLSVRDNLLIEGHRRASLTCGPFLRKRAVDDWANALVRRFDIRISRLNEPVSGLSGGNQQKVVVARSLDQAPDLLVAVNPTRGLDLRATRLVRDQIRNAANAGAMVVLFSTDTDELDEVADRTYFLADGVLSERSFAKALAGEV